MQVWSKLPDFFRFLLGVARLGYVCLNGPGCVGHELHRIRVNGKDFQIRGANINTNKKGSKGHRND